MSTTAQRERMLHTGELILDEARRAGIKVWIGEAGGLLRTNCRMRPYFTRMFRDYEYQVKLALEYESERPDPSDRR